MSRKIVLCNVVGKDIAGFVEEAQRRIAAEVELPPGYHVTFGGQFEGQQRAMRQLGLFMGVVALVAFVVLFSSFGSVWQSFLVLINVPTTLAGAILGLLVMGETVNVSSMIGLVALFGSAPRTTSCSWGRSTTCVGRVARCATPCSRARACGSAPS
jgi:cobalt-zinc-cadmium resistance protein CzcA